MDNVKQNQDAYNSTEFGFGKTNWSYSPAVLIISRYKCTNNLIFNFQQMVNSPQSLQIISSFLPFGGDQCLDPYEAFNSKYSICSLSFRKIKKPAARFAILFKIFF